MIQTAVTSLGFPIVGCVAMAYFIKTLWNKSQEQNEKREEKLYGVVALAQLQNAKLSETNSQFVNILNVYRTDLETIKDDVKEIKISQSQLKQ